MAQTVTTPASSCRYSAFLFAKNLTDCCVPCLQLRVESVIRQSADLPLICDLLRTGTRTCEEYTEQLSAGDATCLTALARLYHLPLVVITRERSDKGGAQFSAVAFGSATAGPVDDVFCPDARKTVCLGLIRASSPDDSGHFIPLEPSPTSVSGLRVPLQLQQGLIEDGYDSDVICNLWPAAPEQQLPASLCVGSGKRKRQSNASESAEGTSGQQLSSSSSSNGSGSSSTSHPVTALGER